MSTDVVFAIPGDIATQSGGYLYDRRLIQELEAQGFSVKLLSLSESFPYPSEADLLAAALALVAVPKSSILVVDGLAFGALTPEVLEGISAPIVALVHHPLAYETGLTEEIREALFQSESRNLESAQHVIVTSHYTADLLTENYGVSSDRLSIATPGNDKTYLPSNPQSPPLILSVGIKVRRKGHDVLINALSKITDLEWRAVIAGPALDAQYSESLTDLVGELRLEDRVELKGFISGNELLDLYSKTTVFALATRFEGYGIVFAEALSQGLPIVSSRTSAVPSTVGGEAAVLVDVEDAEAFSVALRQLLSDPELCMKMSKAAKLRGESLPSWSETGRLVARVLATLKPSPRVQKGLS